MATTRPEPTGAEHDFGDDELFFSTTDRRGVIEQVNATFVRLSHYGADELVGAPHNLIRHPAMPGGAFALLWEQIESGAPASVYVDNLAQDGGRYRVLATVVPVGDGYLSVRMRPREQTLVELSFRLYDEALAAETQARADGLSAHDAAQVGKASIAEGLQAVGIRNATELAAALLTAELAQHHTRTGGLPTRPDARGSAADILTAMHELDAEQAALVPALDELASVATDLDAAWPRVAPALADLDRAVHAASAPVEGVSGELAEDLAYHAAAMTERVETMRAAVDGMPERLAAVRDAVTSVRLRLALLRLCTLMVATFAAEIIDGEEVGDGHAALALLAQALDEGADVVARELSTLEADLGEVGDRLRTAVSETDRLRRPLYRWQSAAQEAGRADLAETVPTEVEGLAELSALAARCRLHTVPFDAKRVRAHAASVRALV